MLSSTCTAWSNDRTEVGEEDEGEDDESVVAFIYSIKRRRRRRRKTTHNDVVSCVFVLCSYYSEDVHRTARRACGGKCMERAGVQNRARASFEKGR